MKKSQDPGSNPGGPAHSDSSLGAGFEGEKRATKSLSATFPEFAKSSGAKNESKRPNSDETTVFDECTNSNEITSGFATKKKGKRHNRIWSIGLDRGFSKEELKRFLDAIESPKHRLCFELMAYLGFRISEAVRVNLADMDLGPERRLIRMWDCKGKTWISRVMPDDAYYSVRRYINTYLDEIDAHGGFLIFSNSPSKTREYVSCSHMRRVFRDTINKARLDDTYAEINAEKGQPGKRRKLYRLSTHSLRRFFIGRVYEVTRNPLLTQRAARHSSFSSTECYLDSVDKSVEKGIQEAFSGLWRRDHVEKGDSGLEEFFEFYRAFRKIKR